MEDPHLRTPTCLDLTTQHVYMHVHAPDAPDAPDAPGVTSLRAVHRNGKRQQNLAFKQRHGRKTEKALQYDSIDRTMKDSDNRWSTRSTYLESTPPHFVSLDLRSVVGQLSRLIQRITTRNPRPNPHDEQSSCQ